MGHEDQQTSPARPHLRPLLPRPEGVSNASSLVISKSRATAACEACRRRRSKCDTRQPCAQCSSRNLECVYDAQPEETHSQALKRKFSELQTRQSAYQELYMLLQNKSYDDAISLLHQIRLGTEVDKVLQRAREGDLLLQMSLVPETRLRYEFPYGPSIAPCFRQTPSNPYLDSLIYEFTLPNQSPKHEALRQTETSQQTSQYLKPYHAAELVEPLLSNAKISCWTTVTTDEAFLQSLLQRYFLHHYQYWPFFHKDMFLKHMSTGKRRFCSPLLVNAILAEACHGHPRVRYRNEPWNPLNLGYSFLAEARRLWDLEKGNNRITTVQAALVMNMAVNMDGLDKVGWSYLRQAIRMAKDMELFKRIEVPSRKMKIVRDFTAWALFAWQVVSTYHFYIPPILPNPPDIPLPDSSALSLWDSEVWFRFPAEQSITCAQHSYIFHATFRLRAIMNDISKSFHKKRSEMSLEAAFQFYERLKDFFRTLPDCLKPQKIALPAQLKLHIHYYTVVITLFQPHASVSAEVPLHQTSTPFGTGESPLQILNDAKTCLETVIRLYYMRHSFEAYDPMMVFFLSILGFTAIADLSQSNADPDVIESSQAAVMLAAKGTYDQGRHCHLSRTITRLLFSTMGPDQARLFRETVTVEDIEADQLLLEHVKSSLPISIVSTVNDADKRRIDQLVEDLIGTDSDNDNQTSDEQTPELGPIDADI